jgi:hypothetical protein
MVDDPELEFRLEKARYEGLFEQHLRQVFGERHSEFSTVLRSQLRELWELARTPFIARFVKDVGMRIDPLHQEVADPQVVPNMQYPGTTASVSPRPASPQRDRRRPPCRHCGGDGMGDYPYACNHCGGTGND